jgi:hypothetical protein
LKESALAIWIWGFFLRTKDEVRMPEMGGFQPRVSTVGNGWVVENNRFND